MYGIFIASLGALVYAWTVCTIIQMRRDAQRDDYVQRLVTDYHA